MTQRAEANIPMVAACSKDEQSSELGWQAHTLHSSFETASSCDVSTLTELSSIESSEAEVSSLVCERTREDSPRDAETPKDEHEMQATEAAGGRELYGASTASELQHTATEEQKLLAEPEAQRDESLQETQEDDGQLLVARTVERSSATSSVLESLAPRNNSVEQWRAASRASTRKLDLALRGLRDRIAARLSACDAQRQAAVALPMLEPQWIIEPNELDGGFKALIASEIQHAEAEKQNAETEEQKLLAELEAQRDASLQETRESDASRACGGRSLKPRGASLKPRKMSLKPRERSLKPRASSTSSSTPHDS